MNVNSLPKTVTRQRRGCDLNPGLSAPESSTLTTRLLNHPIINSYHELLISKRGFTAHKLNPSLQTPVRTAALKLVSRTRQTPIDLVTWRVGLEPLSSYEPLKSAARYPQGKTTRTNYKVSNKPIPLRDAAEKVAFCML